MQANCLVTKEYSTRVLENLDDRDFFISNPVTLDSNDFSGNLKLANLAHVPDLGVFKTPDLDNRPVDHYDGSYAFLSGFHRHFHARLNKTCDIFVFKNESRVSTFLDSRLSNCMVKSLS